MKSHYFPSESLIGGWYIPENVCDNLVQYFKDNSLKHQSVLRHNEYDSDGFTPLTKKVVRTKRTDIRIHPNNFEPVIDEYRKHLQECLLKYIEKYLMVNNVKKFNIFCDYVLQYYKPGEGYFLDHFENDHRGANLNRVLVFMTYLNDVPDGGTNFKYQRFTTPAIKGLTVIWPAYFTHVHSGQITKEHEKYIITGWYTTDE